MTFSIPSVGDLLVVEILRVINGKGSECKILAKLSLKGPTVFKAPHYKGLIRPGDVLIPAISGELPEPFRAGDLVKAKVISLGDSKYFFLSTVPEDCGVVVAEGDLEFPCSYRLIGNEDRSRVVSRKVAKPLQVLLP